MEFSEFKDNVTQWATTRGIYEQSTETKQLVKAFEELGELMVAIDENDIDEIKDAIGDIAVCIVNVCHFQGSYLVGSVKTAGGLRQLTRDLIDGHYNYALGELDSIAGRYELTLEDCLEAAWREIKDRKGMMVEGLYVKWENLNDKQKEQFLLRQFENEGV